MLAARRSQREAYVDEVAAHLREELAVNDLQAEVNGRPKGIYSIHNKIEKYAAEGKELSDIYDLYALRVIVDDVADCYKALGIAHRMWSPMPGQFDDYIATPSRTCTSRCIPRLSATADTRWKCRSKPTRCTVSRNTGWRRTGGTRRGPAPTVARVALKSA